MAGLVEATSFVLLWLAQPSLPTPSRWKDERRRAFESLAAATPVAQREPDFRIVASGLVLHPYFGFVGNPGDLTEWGVAQNDEGFLEPLGLKPAADRRYTVAIAGGSFAHYLFLQGRQALVAELSKAPSLAGRELWIESYAFSGVKQPQQLLMLAYMAARGRQPDVLINIDGFNEVVLPAAENAAVGINPFYPRAWRDLASLSPDSGRLLRLGRLAYLQSLRASWSDTCSPPFLRWSPTCQVIWRARDRGLSAEITALATRLTLEPADVTGFRVAGPPYDVSDQGALRRELVALWAKSSEALDGLCRAQGIRYFHFLQPNQYVPESKPMSEAEKSVALAPNSRYGVHAERGYPDLIARGQELERHGIAYTDLTRVFGSIPEPLYRDACCHVNQRGNEILGRKIGEIVARLLAR